MMLLERVIRTSNHFEEGWRFLCCKGEANIHMRAAYEGTSTYNLAATILFDKTGIVHEPSSYLDRPVRYLLRGSQGDLEGAMVVVQLPEFGRELDFESYVLIETDNVEAYRRMLDECTALERLEVVCFRREHERWLLHALGPRPVVIHDWAVFGRSEGQAGRACRLPTLGLNVTPRIGGLCHLGGRVGAWGLDSLVLRQDGSEAELMVRCYCSGVSEIQVVCPQGGLRDEEALSRLIEGVVGCVLGDGSAVVWRLRGSDVQRYSSIVRAAQFTAWGCERHFHLGGGDKEK